MNENYLQQEIQKKVLNRIRTGNARMHSRAYFHVRVVFTLAVAILTFAVSTFVLSFIVFSVHESGEQFLLGFGGRGVLTFLALFPWLTLIFNIALLFLLEWLLQSYKIGYRFSLLAVFIAIFVISVVLAAIVDLTPTHSILLDRADRDQLPVIGEMYDNIRDSHQAQGVYRGTIASINGNEIVITHHDNDHDADDGTWTVMLPQADTPQLALGDRVYIFGSATGNVVQAYGIRVLSPDQ